VAVRLTVGIALLAVAVVLFLLAAFGVAIGGIDFVALGLAAFAGAFVADRALTR
jgi:hypothetical protein